MPLVIFLRCSEESKVVNHKHRFLRWYKTISDNRSYLVDLVLSEIVPQFESSGFTWYENYAGGNVDAIAGSSIPLQRRQGDYWPTVEIQFLRGSCVSFRFYIALLPERCIAFTESGFKEIPRESACVSGGQAYFYSDTGTAYGYGYSWFTLFPKYRLRKEVMRASYFVKELIKLFEEKVLDGEIEYKGDLSELSLFSAHSIEEYDRLNISF